MAAGQLTFADILRSDQLTFGATSTVGDILLSLIITFITAMFIYYIYKKTYSGVLYSKNFNITIILIALIVSMIMMGIHNNLALSLGMVGALSIIRFRTAIKDPKDVAFVFWAISIGIVNGVAYYRLSVIGSLFIGAVMLILPKRLEMLPPYMLMIKHQDSNEREIKRAIIKYCKKHRIRHRSSDENIDEIILEVRMKEKFQATLIKELKAIKGIKSVLIFSHEGELTE
ncbi:MAG: DUF4956 domain-containing protein [Nanoarchaeota archaeon]|nr:DUF4956 domain-containing protein [Nanoarchaeota archaeon]